MISIGLINKVRVAIPAFEYCGDNAAMIALRGMMLYQEGERFSLDTPPFPAMSSKYFI